MSLSRDLAWYNKGRKNSVIFTQYFYVTDCKIRIQIVYGLFYWQYPQIHGLPPFWGNVHACAYKVYQAALFKRPGIEARESLANRVTFLGFQTVKSGRVGNGRGDDAKTGWLLSLLLYRFSEIWKILCTWNNIFSWCIQEFKLAIAYWHSFKNYKGQVLSTSSVKWNHVTV